MSGLLKNYPRKLLGWNKGEAEGGGGMLKVGDFLAAQPGLPLGEDFRVERHTRLFTARVFTLTIGCSARYRNNSTDSP